LELLQASRAKAREAMNSLTLAQLLAPMADVDQCMKPITALMHFDDLSFWTKSMKFSVPDSLANFNLPNLGTVQSVHIEILTIGMCPSNSLSILLIF
jgi:hypothetical protein